MYCFNCGKEIPDTSRFCPYCGADMTPLQKSGKRAASGAGPKTYPWSGSIEKSLAVKASSLGIPNPDSWRIDDDTPVFSMKGDYAGCRISDGLYILARGKSGWNAGLFLTVVDTRNNTADLLDAEAFRYVDCKKEDLQNEVKGIAAINDHQIYLACFTAIYLVDFAEKTITADKKFKGGKTLRSFAYDREIDRYYYTLSGASVSLYDWDGLIFRNKKIEYIKGLYHGAFVANDAFDICSMGEKRLIPAKEYFNIEDETVKPRAVYLPGKKIAFTNGDRGDTLFTTTPKSDSMDEVADAARDYRASEETYLEYGSSDHRFEDVLGHEVGIEFSGYDYVYRNPDGSFLHLYHTATGDAAEGVSMMDSYTAMFWDKEYVILDFKHNKMLVID